MEKLIHEYIVEHLPKTENWIKELEHQAKLNHVPIMDPIGMNFLLQLIRLHQPKKILEIGTAIGYSALRMVDASPGTTVTTIEKDPERYKEAIKNIEQLHQQNKVHVIQGDAIEVIPTLSSTYDCVFIDAAKGQYKRFFELASPLLEDNGFIVTDNVLFRGYVVDEDFAHPRYKKMVEKIRLFNDWLVKHPDYVTTIFPIGDGVAISYKQEEHHNEK